MRLVRHGSNVSRTLLSLANLLVGERESRVRKSMPPSGNARCLKESIVVVVLNSLKHPDNWKSAIQRCSSIGPSIASSRSSSISSSSSSSSRSSSSKSSISSSSSSSNCLRSRSSISSSSSSSSSS
ncbi:uncharacterized protein DDB_G0271670-like [Ruditapes philippinarum]|uniref:uncharacterized protein DDB_G0271670-like n=1 Tax=Ruditapes philippinarum TaxID=129788 RepID=UPI00295B617A|nr:uncharacterized protein DDB_G0271670-like [Ruditapes philippinarum]